MSVKPEPASGFPLSLRPRVVFGSFCWVLSLGFFIVEAIVRAASTAPYSVIENYISDLGAVNCGTVTVKTYQAYVCSPLHSLMNSAYVGVGALAFVGAIALRPAWPKTRLAKTGLILVGLAGLGAVIAGLYPEDVNIDLHLLGALLAVPLSNIGMGLLALSVRRHSRGLAVFTGLTVLIGIVGLVLTGMPDSGIGIGLAERLAGYPFEIWKTVVAVILLTAWLRHRRSVATTGNPMEELSDKAS